MTHDQECKFDPKYCRDCKLQAEARADERLKIEAPIRALVATSKHCELKYYDIDHDGGECCIRMKTIRKVLDGEWTVDV